MRRFIFNLVSVLFSAVKFGIMKLFHFHHFFYSSIQRFSPNTEVVIAEGGTIRLGRHVRAHRRSKLLAMDGGTLEIGSNTALGNGVSVNCMESVVIGEGVQIGPDTKIYDHDHDYRVPGGIGAGKFVTAPVTIGDNSWIGCNVVILRGTSIGKNCIVGAGSVLKGAYPAGSVIVQKRQTTVTVLSNRNGEVTMEHKPYGPYETYFKRPLDILCALAALIVFGWLYILVAVLVRIKLGSPVIFKQPRPGRDEKIFDLYKFRSMTDERDENGELLPDEQRLTKFGKVLRATSLDELPEAFNILKGDMSVIGPRPLLVKYLPRYSERQHRRHEVRPGLSGYAQVHGRNTVSWQDKFEMDVKYVDHITFLGDLKIIWDSVMAAFVRRDGISSEMSVTMEEFMGNGMVAK